MALSFVAVASPVWGQAVHTKGSSAPTAAAAIAVPAPAPRQATVAPPPPQMSQVVPSYFRRVPVVVMSDGRVYADFGRGYEQVLVACGSSASYGVSNAAPLVQPTASQPTIVQPNISVQPNVSVPVTNQAAVSPMVTTSTTAGQACWTTDAYGQVVIGRP